MLDEFREASEYIYDLDKVKNGSERIQMTNFLRPGHFLGIERIMTTIARFFLFHDGTGEDRRIYRAEAALRLWFGYDRDDIDDEAVVIEYDALVVNHPEIIRWLPRYLELHKEKKRDPKKAIEDAERLIENYKKEFAISSFNKSSKNDYKRIRYDKIIANALVSRGELKRYYLASDDPNWGFGVSGIKGNKLNYPDRLLKTMAAYLLERKRKGKENSALSFEPVNFKDITNWASASDRLDSEDYDAFSIDGRPLFVFKELSTNNIKKIKPDEEWFYRCGWKLIEATHNDDLLDEHLKDNPYAAFFRDDGGGTYIMPDSRYER